MGWWHRRPGLPEDAVDLVEAHITHWRHLDDDEETRLLELTEWLLQHKSWEAANGFALDDTIRTVIGAQAALLILGLTPDHYGQVTAIIVHPSTSMQRGERAGPVSGTATDDLLPIYGLAQDRRGPVVMAWDQARSAARHPERGHNVVFHEFAHKLDMLDGMIDGTPPLAREDLPEWSRICTERLRRPPGREAPPTAAGLRRGEHRRVLRRGDRGLLRRARRAPPPRARPLPGAPGLLPPGPGGAASRTEATGRASEGFSVVGRRGRRL